MSDESEVRLVPLTRASGAWAEFIISVRDRLISSDERAIAADIANWLDVLADAWESGITKHDAYTAIYSDEDAAAIAKIEAAFAEPPAPAELRPVSDEEAASA